MATIVFSNLYTAMAIFSLLGFGETFYQYEQHLVVVLYPGTISVTP